MRHRRSTSVDVSSLIASRGGIGPAKDYLVAATAPSAMTGLRGMVAAAHAHAAQATVLEEEEDDGDGDRGDELGDASASSGALPAGVRRSLAQMMPPPPEHGLLAHRASAPLHHHHHGGGGAAAGQYLGPGMHGGGVGGPAPVRSQSIGGSAIHGRGPAAAPLLPPHVHIQSPVMLDYAPVRSKCDVCGRSGPCAARLAMRPAMAKSRHLVLSVGVGL